MKKRRKRRRKKRKKRMKRMKRRKRERKRRRLRKRRRSHRGQRNGWGCCSGLNCYPPSVRWPRYSLYSGRGKKGNPEYPRSDYL